MSATLANSMGPCGLAAVGTGTDGGRLELPVGAALVPAGARNSSFWYGSHDTLSVASLTLELGQDFPTWVYHVVGARTVADVEILAALGTKPLTVHFAVQSHWQFEDHRVAQAFHEIDFFRSRIDDFDVILVRQSL
jgi:hypothetical protein